MYSKLLEMGSGTPAEVMFALKRACRMATIAFKPGRNKVQSLVLTAVNTMAKRRKKLSRCFKSSLKWGQALQQR